jgi:hypothetical protein
MARTITEFGPDRLRVTVMPVRRHPGRRDAGDGLGGSNERHRGRHAACFAEPDVRQRTRNVDGAIEIASAALDFDVGFVDGPTLSDPATPPAMQSLAQHRRELGFPVASSFVGEDDAGARAPRAMTSEGLPGPVQQAVAALLKLFAAGAAAEPAVALRGAPRSFRHSERAALHTPHPFPPCQ